MIFGHTYKGSKMLDKLVTENHHSNSKDYIYTINVMECKCGLSYLDAGMETRDRLSQFKLKAEVK